MMLHRHFEAGNGKTPLTKTDDLSNRPDEEFVSDIFPPDEDKPKRGRKKKED